MNGASNWTRSKGRRAASGLLILIALGICPADGSSAVRRSPQVIANHETLSGSFSRKYPTLATFKGIPFAEPPVGKLRWQAPRPHPPRAGIQSARKFAAACYQDSYNTEWYRNLAKAFGVKPSTFTDPPVSEDCLYLNVWTPALKLDAQLPVMVWIHGGSNKSGWSFEPNYWGENLAAQARVVVVSIAYRLGIFGFFGHPNLRGSSAPANFGLLDQIAALHWVRDNIAQFGGDPANVTVFGESAGAEDIGYLMTSPLARSLFQRAISESGGYLMRDVADLSQAEKIGTSLSGAMSHHPGLAELRRKPASEIFKAAEHAMPGLYFHAVVDGISVPEPPAAYYQHEGVPVDLLIGSNENEYYMHDDDKPDSLISDFNALPPSTREPLALRAAEEPSVRRGRDKAIAFVDMACPPYLMAASAHLHGHLAWVYRFSRVRPGPGGAAVLAYHGAEIPYIFDTHDAWLPTDRTDRDLTNAMMRYWGNFARTGDPNGEGLVSWPAFQPTHSQLLDLGSRISPVAAPDKALCDQLASDLYPGWAH